MGDINLEIDLFDSVDDEGTPDQKFTLLTVWTRDAVVDQWGDLSLDMQDFLMEPVEVASTYLDVIVQLAAESQEIAGYFDEYLDTGYDDDE